eukprot:gb/GECG01014393.1/.p1 GENE.gb/GECG01014393.1/~~gb/GECG01014393.1/.p1  ORF type:complete len:571 (+),score=62.50 gb/GECG01014393.1/:1-1713(+)
MGKLPKFIQPQSANALDTLLNLCVFAPHRPFTVAMQHLAYSFHHEIALTLLARRALHKQTMTAADLNAILKSVYKMDETSIGIITCAHLESACKRVSGLTNQKLELPTEASESIQYVAQSIGGRLNNDQWLPSLPVLTCIKGLEALHQSSPDSGNAEISSEEDIITRGEAQLSLNDLCEKHMERTLTSSSCLQLPVYGNDRLEEFIRDRPHGGLAKKDVIAVAKQTATGHLSDSRKTNFIDSVIDRWNAFCDSEDFPKEYQPNARSYLLLFASSVKSRHVDKGKTAVQKLHQSVHNDLHNANDLYKHLVYICQPELMREAAALGILHEEDVKSALNPKPGTGEYCFLRAAECARLGDQKGSKHGAVIVVPLSPVEPPKDHQELYFPADLQAESSGVYVSKNRLFSFGQNHVTHVTDAELKEAQERAANSETMSMCCQSDDSRRDTTFKQPAKRQKTSTAQSPSTQKHVMHSEIHAAVRALMSSHLRSSSVPADVPLQGAHCWVVELDGIGVGYEEAVPCAMCNMGLIRLGIANIYYSCHEGLRLSSRTPSRKMGCVSLEMGLLSACHEKR